MTVNSVISTPSDETLPARNADMFPGRPGRSLVPPSPDLVPSRRAVSKYRTSAPGRVVFVPRRSSPRFLSSRRLFRLGSAAPGRSRAPRASASSPGHSVRRNPPFRALRPRQRRGERTPPPPRLHPPTGAGESIWRPGCEFCNAGAGARPGSEGAAFLEEFSPKAVAQAVPLPAQPLGCNTEIGACLRDFRVFSAASATSWEVFSFLFLGPV